MAEQRKATMPTNVNLMRWSDEVKLFCQSQRIAHFQITLPASSVYSDNYHKRPLVLTVPTRFVAVHGDKIRRFVILRPASSTKSWTVSLSVSVRRSTQVKIIGGWRQFSVSNGLARGDSLIFALTAVSEFEVYVFRTKPENPKDHPSQPAPRSWSKDSEIARKKAKQSRKQLTAAENVNVGAVKSNGLIAETNIVRDPKENLISASGHSPTSCRFSCHGNANKSEKAHNPSPTDHRGHESAEDQYELKGKSVSATTYGPAHRTRARAKLGFTVRSKF